MSTYTELKNYRMFKGISKVALDFFVIHTHVHPFKPNTILINEGDKIDYLYLIVEGDCDVIKIDHETGIQHFITTLTKGDSIGEISLLDSKSRSAIIQAKTDGILYAFSIKDLETFAKLYPQDYLIIIKNLGKILSFRLRHVNVLAAASLTAKLKSAAMRLKMGNFIVLVIGMLCIYSFLQSFANALIRESGTDLFASSLILIVILIPTILFLKHEKYKLSAYGFNTLNWQKNIIEAFIFTLPLLALVVITKSLFIKFIPAFQHETLFNGPIVLQQKIVYLVMLVYILSCPVQEFISRGILQTSLHKFLTNKSTLFAILMSNLIYSTFHLYLSFFYALATFIPGLFFGWMYARQKSLLGPIVSHIMFGVWSIYIVGLRGLITT